MSFAVSHLLKRNAERDVKARDVLPDGQVTDMRALAKSGVTMAVERRPMVAESPLQPRPRNAF